MIDIQLLLLQSNTWNHLTLCKQSKVGNRSRGCPEGSLFDSYYTKV